MKFLLFCWVLSPNPGELIAEWHKNIEASDQIEAIHQARIIKDEYISNFNDPELVIKTTLGEPDKKPFWFSERGKFKRQSDTS